MSFLWNCEITHSHTHTHTRTHTHTHTVHVTAAMYRTHMPACLPIYPWIAVIAVKMPIFTEFQSHTLQIASYGFSDVDAVISCPAAVARHLIPSAFQPHEARGAHRPLW